MTTMNHTKGPWHAFHAMSSICVGGNQPIQRIEDVEANMHIEVFGDNKVADALLIAAAPSMLDLLKECRSELFSHLHSSGDPDDPENMVGMAILYREIGAVIEKATTLAN